MVGTHEGAELSAVMVGGHEQVALIFVRVFTGRLGGRGQTLEIELVRIPFSMHLRHDIFVVIISAKIRRQKRGIRIN